MREKPAESLGSVDNALRLLHLLRDEGRLGVSDVARALDISTSAAHRLLTALVFRDFASRDDDRKYRPGPALSLPAGGAIPIRVLRDTCLPGMTALGRELGETISLGVLVDQSLRIVATAECDRVLRIGDQEGTVLPAASTAIGKAILACRGDLTARFTRPEPPTREQLPAQLTAARAQGFAVNNGEAEQGVAAVAVPIPAAPRVIAGVAAVMPSVRYRQERVRPMVERLHEAAYRMAMAMTERT